MSEIVHHIFLSYARKDVTLMQRIKQTLIASGLSVWTDEGISPGTPLWDAAIEKALENAGCMVVILTPNVKDAGGVRAEIHYARIHDVLIFPVLAEGSEIDSVPWSLSGTQWIDIRSSKFFIPGILRLTDSIFQYLQIDREQLMLSAEAMPQQEGGYDLSISNDPLEEIARQFRDSEKKIDLLRQKYQMGFLTLDELQERLRENIILDNDNQWWMMGIESTGWYRYDGGNWVSDSPPGTLSPSRDYSDLDSEEPPTETDSNGDYDSHINAHWIDDENAIADNLFNEAVAIVYEYQIASISFLQKQLQIGYTKAARLLDDMEEQGLVGPNLPDVNSRTLLFATSGTVYDEIYEQAIVLVRRLNKASISLLQRRMRISYARAARLIETMEANGIIGPKKESSRSRDILPYD